MARALSFEERDHQGQTHGFVDTPRTRTDGRPVPAPGLVDVDSLIQIYIDKSQLTSAPASHLDHELAGALRAEHEVLTSVVQQLDGVAQAKRALFAAHAQLVQAQERAGVEPSAVLAAVKADPQGELAEAFGVWTRTMQALDEREGDVFQLLDETYEGRDQEFYEALEESAGEDLEGFRSILQLRLQQSLAEANEGQEKLLKPLKEEQSTLQLELSAWLISKNERAQIHLQNYDDLDTGRVKPLHGSALDLSEEDRAALDAQWKSTVRLANSLEAYRNGTQQLQEVIDAARPMLAAEISAVLDAANTLQDSWATLQPNQLRKDVAESLQSLHARAEEEGVESATLDALNAVLRDLPGAPDTLATLEEYLRKLADANRRAQSMRAEDLPSFLFETSDLLREGAELLSADQLRTLLTETNAPADIVTRLEQRAATTDEEQAPANTEAIESVRTLMEEPEFTGLNDQIEALAKVCRDAANLMASVRQLAPVLKGDPGLPQALGAINSFRVPHDRIKDTSIDILTIPRQPGDRIEFQARLYAAQTNPTGAAPEQPLDRLDASFEIREFGWHQRLSPSVVLARPTRLDGRDETFSFAPLLSWVHRYGVRPEEDTWYAETQRLLDMSVGIHASFLNFDPDKEVEIGLGLTLSFWKERLQVGAGSNLMASTNGDGRYYVFLGSDLISLLNTAGIGN